MTPGPAADAPPATTSTDPDASSTDPDPRPPDPVPTGPPPLGTVQTREEVLAAVGSRSRRTAVLRAAGGGPVVGLTVRLDLNPEAPRVVVLSAGDRPLAEARQMVDQATPLPVWARTRDGWTYVGRWLPVAVDVGALGARKARAAAPARAASEDPPPAGVLRLEPVGEVTADPVT